MSRFIIVTNISLLLKNLFLETFVPVRLANIENISDKKPELIILPYFEKISYHDEICGVWEILIWLRIHNIMCHVCIVGNMPIENLLRHERRAFMLGSRGVSYMQLPEILDQVKINKKIGDNADPENVRSVMSMLVDIQHMRHVYANIWGLERLVEIHKKYFKDFKWEPSKEYNKKSKSLDYQMAIYVFVKANKKDDKNEIEDSRTIDALKDLKKALRKKPDLNVLLIDDKADSGWESVIKSLIEDMFFEKGISSWLSTLQSLLPSKKTVYSMPIKNYDDDLMVKFQQIYVDYSKIDVIISDLRLYPQEELEIDYNNFKSIKLMKNIYDKKNKQRRLVFNKVRYILFTASNQLMNYKNVIHSKYAPSGIYVKEGFDHIVNPGQQEENYRNLVNALSAAVNENYRKTTSRAGGGVENASIADEKRLEYVDYAILNGIWNSIFEEIIRCFEGYDHVLLDTNIFYHDEDPLFIALCGSDKIRCFYPVYKEMERLSESREFSFRSYMAAQACQEYATTVFKNGLTNMQIIEINEKIETAKNNKKNGTDLTDLADKYFLPAIRTMYENNPKLKILFITGDVKENGPYEEVSMWLKSFSIETVHVLTPWNFYKKNGIVLPENKLLNAVSNRLGTKNKAVNSIELGTLRDCLMSLDERSYIINLHNKSSVIISIQEFKKPTDIGGFENIKYKKYIYKNLADLTRQIIKDWPEKKR